MFINYSLFLITCILHPTHMASFVNYSFFSRTEALIFLKRHIRLFVKPAIWALSFFTLMTTVLLQLLNKMHMKYVFHNRFSMIVPIKINQKALSLNFKSSRSQMFFKIGVLNNFAIFAGKHLCWSYFLIKLQARRSAILLKRDSNTGVFLWILRNF